MPGEALDLDEAFEKVLIDVGGRKTLFTIGKHGILWKLDRETGEFLGHTETVFQNIFTTIDPDTGRVTYRQDIADAGVRRLGRGLAPAPPGVKTGTRPRSARRPTRS